LRENLNVSNPYYHTTGDTIGGGFNAYTMVYQGVRAAVATIASLAIPYRTHIAEPATVPVRHTGIRVKATIVTGRRLKVELAEPLRGTAVIRVYDIRRALPAFDRDGLRPRSCGGSRVAGPDDTRGLLHTT
jgi:hypothetical protein